MANRVVSQSCRRKPSSSDASSSDYDTRFPWQMALHLTGAGLDCVDTPQGCGLNEAIRKPLQLSADEQLVTDHDPILAWMADNAVTREGRQKELRLDTEQSRERIDGIVALVMVVSAWIRNDGQQTSAYADGHGLTVV